MGPRAVACMEAQHDSDSQREQNAPWDDLYSKLYRDFERELWLDVQYARSGKPGRCLARVGLVLFNLITVPALVYLCYWFGSVTDSHTPKHHAIAVLTLVLCFLCALLKVKV